MTQREMKISSSQREVQVSEGLSYWELTVVVFCVIRGKEQWIGVGYEFAYKYQSF